MLKQLRSKKLKKRVLQGVLILIIPSFVFFYGWNSSKNRPNEAGYIPAHFRSPALLNFWPFNRWQPVSAGELRSAADRLVSRRQMESMFSGSPYRPNISPDQFTLSERLAEALNQRIIREYADKTGLVVSDDEMENELKTRFPTNTKSMVAAYCAYRNVSLEQFLHEMHEEMLNERVARMFLNQARVSLFETWQEYSLLEEQLQLDYVKVLASSFENKVTVDEKDLEKYFKDQGEDFRIPKQRKYDYLSVSRARIDEQTTITDNEARAYYDKNRETNLIFRSSPRVKIRQIVLKYKDPKTPVVSDELSSRTKTLLQKAQTKGADFAALADAHSEDEANTEKDAAGRTVKKGGLAGWISQDETAKWGQAFVTAALELKPGEISKNYVEAPDGVHILKAEERQDAEVLLYEKVVEQARTAAKAKLVKDRFEKDKARFLEAAKQVSSLGGLSKALGTKVEQTGFIDEKDFAVDPKIGSLARDDEYIGSLTPGEMSSPLETPTGVICLSVAESRDSRIPDLKEVRQKVETNYRAHKALEAAEAKAKEGLDKGKSLQDLQAWAKAASLTVQTTDFFPRLAAPPGLNETIDRFAQMTYKTPVGATRESALLSAGETVGCIVWRIHEIKQADPAKFAKEKNNYQRQILFLKQWALFDEWLANARKQWGVKLTKPVE